MPSRGQLRIIGGEWRRRRLAFPALPGVRPSPERLRETLFNWLTPLIEGARCLDLFAGSGALGLEALSRGAAEAVFVDTQAKVLHAIKGHLETLGAGPRGYTRCRDAMAYLRSSDAVFDVVFLDPPFGQGSLVPVLQALSGHLSANHRVYVEYGRDQSPAWPDGVEVLKEARAGAVACALLRFRVTPL